MASVQERVLSGGESTYAVLFRQHRRQTSRTFDRESDALKFKALIDQFGADQALRLIQQHAKADEISINQLAERWFAKRQQDVEAGSLTPRVLTGYRRDYTNWIEPWFGSHGVDSLNELDVQNWVDQMRTMPKSAPKTIADRHSILSGMFKWAADPRRGLAERNPCLGTVLPPRTRTLVKGLQLAELYALLEAGERIRPDASDLIAFMAATGWRIGEAVALMAGQVEDDGKSVYVTMGWVWRREVGLVESAKSSAGMRRLRVLGVGATVLRRRVAGLGPTDLVFTTERGYPWDEASFRKRYWKKIVAEAGLTHRAPTPHWLRHTHVLLCHAAKMPMAEISRRLGHADIRMTINTYGRLIDDMTDEVADNLDTLLTPGALSIQGRVVQGSVEM